MKFVCLFKEINGRNEKLVQCDCKSSQNEDLDAFVQWAGDLTISKSEMEYFNGFDGIPENYLGFQGVVRNIGTSSSPPSLVLDNERGELVKTLMKPGQKLADAEKALVALRNHSEAERRRRERINGHLATLRTLIPGTNKVFSSTGYRSLVEFELDHTIFVSVCVCAQECACVNY